MPVKSRSKAPTVHDRAFHNIKPEYAENSLRRGVEQGTLTAQDADLIRDFITEIRASKGIGTSRANKITYTLVSLRQFIGPYAENSIYDLYRGIEALRNHRVDGHPYRQNTMRDFLNFLKRFYLWLIENDLSRVPRDKVKQIKVPRTDKMTKTAEQLLTEDHVLAMIGVCQSSRDRAIVSLLYEGGFRVKEVGELTWEQVLFDNYGVVVNVDVKTEKPRYVRLIATASYLATWRNDYPFEPAGEALVFLSQQRRPLRYAGVAAQLRKIAHRAGVPKHVTPHLFRHSRITEMVRSNYNESIIKQVMWGDVNTTMLDTYMHLTNRDIDAEILTRMGIRREEERQTGSMTAHQCANCMTINAPTHQFCMQCGQPLSDEVRIGLEGVRREIEQTPEFKAVWSMIEQRLGEAR